MRKPLHLKVRYIAPFGAFTIPHLELKVKVSKAYNTRVSTPRYWKRNGR
jgi:hypothetical protein